MLGQYLKDLRFVQCGQQAGAQQAHPVGHCPLVEDVAPVLVLQPSAHRNAGLVQHVVGLWAHRGLPLRFQEGGQLAAQRGERALPGVRVVPGFFRMPEDAFQRHAEPRRVALCETRNEGLHQAPAQGMHLVRTQAARLGEHGLRHGVRQPRRDRTGAGTREGGTGQGRRPHEAAARLAHGQPGGDLDDLDLSLAALDIVQQQLQRPAAPLNRQTVDAGQGWGLDYGLRLVVKADDGDVLRDAQPGILEFDHRADGTLVAAGQHGREWKPGAQELPHGQPAAVHDVVTVGDEVRIGFQAVLPHSRLVGLKPLFAISVGVLGVAGDEGDTAMAVLDQVRHCLADAARVVNGDGRAAQGRADEDDGVAGVAQVEDVADPGFGDEGIDHDQPVGVPRADRHEIRLRREGGPGGVDAADLAAGEAHAAGQQQVTPPVVRGSANPVKQGAEKVHEIGVFIRFPPGQYADRGLPVLIGSH